MANPLREAIATVLEGDSTLNGLATGVFHRIAPEGSLPPYVIFNKVSGVRAWTFDGPPLLDQVWTVKGVGNAGDAEDLDARCLTLLTDAQLSVSGFDLRLAPMPEDDISYGEDTDGEHYEHVGTHYRIVTEAE